MTPDEPLFETDCRVFMEYLWLLWVYAPNWIKYKKLLNVVCVLCVLIFKILRLYFYLLCTQACQLVIWSLHPTIESNSTDQNIVSCICIIQDQHAWYKIMTSRMHATSFWIEKKTACTFYKCSNGFINDLHSDVGKGGIFLKNEINIIWEYI